MFWVHFDYFYGFYFNKVCFICSFCETFVYFCVLEITGKFWGGPSVQVFCGYGANVGAEPMYTKKFRVPPHTHTHHHHHHHHHHLRY